MNHSVSKTTEIDNLTNSTIIIAKIKSVEGGNGTAKCVGMSATIWTWNIEFVGRNGIIATI